MEQENKNSICESIHSHAEGLYSAGVMDDATIEKYNKHCVGKADEFCDVSIFDHIKIVDADTNEEILNKRG